MTSTRLAIGITIVWLLALGTYGAGYFLRVQEDAAGAATRFLPTVDLLFFGFAIGGPLAMVWIVVLMLNRAERLTEAIEVQSESALALATTISTLNESVDALSEGTTVRLEETCTRMERDITSSTAKLSRALTEIAGKVETTILDSVIMLDKSNRERLSQVEQTLAAERSAFADRLDGDAQKMAAKIEGSADDTKERLDAAIALSIKDHRDRMTETNEDLQAALDTLSTQVAQSIAARTQAMDEGMKRHQHVLNTAAETTRKAIERDLLAPITVMRDTLNNTVNAISVNPPASADELAVLLGDAAQVMIQPERTALTESVDRIAALEQQVRSLLVQIDRTARLNPVIREELDQKSRTADAPLALMPSTRIDHQELPFSTLPRTAARAPLDWTAVVEVLDRADPRPANRAQMVDAKADPDVEAVLKSGASVERELAEEGIYVEDLRPEHASTALWVRFAQGERGDAFKPLSGINDDIAPAIVRGRLRRTPEFRATALRFVTAYITLLQRAISEIGADQRLIEMAETKTGRTFQVLAEPMGILEQSRATFDD